MRRESRKFPIDVPEAHLRSYSTLDRMIAGLILALIVFMLILLLAGCSAQNEPDDFSDWDILNELSGPMRYEKSTWPVDDSSCIDGKDIVLMGDLDADEYQWVIAEVRERYPRDAILLVRRDGLYADVLTGVNCTSPEAGGGDVYLMRKEGMRWKIKGATKWSPSVIRGAAGAWFEGRIGGVGMIASK